MDESVVWADMTPLERLFHMEQQFGQHMSDWMRKAAQEAQDRQDQETPHA